MRRLIISGIIVAVAGVAGAATYYVDDVNGRDDPAWSGGPGDPWCTITYALSRVSGRNTFLCRGTFEEDVPVTYDDQGSEFVGNPAAILNGDVDGSFSTTYTFEGFEIFGCMRGDAITWFSAENCYFRNPDGGALSPHWYNGAAGAEDCIFENCGSVCSVGPWESGGLTIRNCEVTDCGSGVHYSGWASVGVYSTVFHNVPNGAISFGSWEGWTGVENCEFENCGDAVSIYVGRDGVSVRGCTFVGNNRALGGEVYETATKGLEIENNTIFKNEGNGVDVEGGPITLRGNVVRDNGGHGVYIVKGAPDLGTPGDPGGNTFAGNESGYDVYNASSEDIPAYGNTWDPQSEQEMAGKTWQEVNVTRIYDHWDDPSVGYVMWSEPMLGVAPASLGMIKGLFKDAPTSGQAGPASKALGR